MQWARAGSTQEAERQNAQDSATVDQLAHIFRRQNFDLAEYLGLQKGDISDTEKIRQAVREKRVEISQLEASEQGVEHQKLSDVSRVLLTESSRAIYLQSSPFGSFSMLDFGWTAWLEVFSMARPPTEEQQEFFNRVDNAPTNSPHIINDLIREWEASSVSSDWNREHDESDYNQKLVQTIEVGAMICTLTAKLCSSGVTDAHREDSRAIFYEVIHARICFFEQLFRTKLTPDDEAYSGDGLACRQFRKHADLMVNAICQAHEQGLQPDPGVAGLRRDSITNPSDKVGRFIMFKRVSELCGSAGAKSAQRRVHEFCKTHKESLMCTRQEELAVLSRYVIRPF